MGLPETSSVDFSDVAATASAQLRAIPADKPVRLAKKTSNLFRPRTEADADLDLQPFSRVFSVNPQEQTASVGGLTTYEDLVNATLPYGLVPLCVPQLRTITLGGAVTGMGIEAASFRNGCPHESVLGMDILTGSGEVVRATPEQDSDLFYGFTNSYGSLGYALRLDIELEPVTRYVGLRHLRFGSIAEAVPVIQEIMANREFDGTRVDYLDGTVFTGQEQYLTLGHYVQDPAAEPSLPDEPSDYTGTQIYYRSIQQRSTDLLTTLDFLWRWDTDWFWCSRALGTQNKYLRPFWPRKYKRSNVYWKMIDMNRRWGISDRIDKLTKHPEREPVVQDVEIPADALPEFMDFFHREVGISPVWICPLKQRDPAVRWPLYEFDPQVDYVNVGFWSAVNLNPGERADDARINRAIEAEVARLGGRKSLYSTSFYDRETFYATYGQDAYRNLKDKYDPDHRYTDLYEKTVKGF